MHEEVEIELKMTLYAIPLRRGNIYLETALFYIRFYERKKCFDF